MRTCAKCGTKLTAASPAGLCPKCFLQEGLAPLAKETLRLRLTGDRDAERPNRPEPPQKAETAAQEQDVPPQPVVTLRETERLGERIGRYKLLQQIGEGGCGTVYMAEQEEPIRRRVAFKVIKLGMDTRQVIARFEAERQALALMDHPNIAKVLDAGATETGRPYFVMELVRGIKITEYCDENKLSTDERLDLFRQVCQAIQHAHQKGIIHRDIKPSNILVTLQDGRPVPKVIDFGIAKATEQKLTDKTLFTAFEQFIGTPAYMSPEQAEMSAMDIDTRSDIYALGVLLYELLTGTTPFRTDQLARVGVDELRRVIREVEPPRPSTRLGTLGAGQLADAAKRRHAEPPRLISLIKGDLDWIVMKALDKDRSRRYDTAKDLAADVQRHLEHAPVQARPPELWYLAQKFFWRRKRSILAGGLCCAFFLAAVVAGLQHHRAQTLRHAARLASFRQEEAEVVPQFTAASAPATEAATMRFKACLARLADRVRQGQGSPVDCELLARVITSRVGWLGHTIQQIQEPHLRLRAGLGRWNVEGLGAVVFPTITVGNTALRAGGWEGPVDALYLDGWGSESLTTGITKPIGLRGLFSQTGRYRISGILTVQLVKARGRKEQPIRDHVKLADFEAVGPQVRLPLPPLDCTFLKEVPPHFPVELIDAAMSEKIRAGLAVQEAWIDFDAEKRARLHLELFYPYSNDAEPKFPIALAPRLLQLGGAPVLTNEPLVGYRAYGGGGATVQEFVLALPAGMNLPSENRPIAARISIQSSRQMALEEGLDELLAIPEIRKDISIELRRDGSGEAKRGAELVRQGNLAEAELLYRARLESLRPVVRADDPLLARALADLAYTMLCEGKSAEAGSLAQECLGIQEKQMPDNWRTFAARGLLGAALFGQRRYAQAEPLLLSGYEGLSQRAKWIPPDQKRTQLALPLAELVHLYTALGQTDRALEQCRKTAESTDLQLLNSLAWFLATRKNPYERDGKVAAILAGRVAAATSRKQPFVLDTLAAAYAEAGEFDKAISTQREAIGLLNDAREKSDYTSRLKLYQSNTPYREP